MDQELLAEIRRCKTVQPPEEADIMRHMSILMAPLDLPGKKRVLRWLARRTADDQTRLRATVADEIEKMEAEWADLRARYMADQPAEQPEQEGETHDEAK